jgi:hypothetical protein
MPVGCLSRTGGRRCGHLGILAGDEAVGEGDECECGKGGKGVSQ